MSNDPHARDGLLPAELVTPSDLVMMRRLIGLERPELAKLLGVSSEDARDMERPRNEYVYSDHVDILNEWIERIDEEIERALSYPQPRACYIVYGDDETFLQYEPELAWMQFTSVHRQYVYRVVEAWSRQDRGVPNVVEFVPGRYHAFLESGGLPNNRGSLQGWAKIFAMAVKTRPGLPRGARRPR